MPFEPLGFGETDGFAGGGELAVSVDRGALWQPIRRAIIISRVSARGMSGFLLFGAL
jgi:hypothetical protein